MFNTARSQGTKMGRPHGWTKGSIGGLGVYFCLSWFWVMVTFFSLLVFGNFSLSRFGGTKPTWIWNFKIGPSLMKFFSLISSVVSTMNLASSTLSSTCFISYFMTSSSFKTGISIGFLHLVRKCLHLFLSQPSLWQSTHNAHLSSSKPCYLIRYSKSFGGDGKILASPFR